ncbi:MAG TPA: acyl-CoA dehydrogenase family protein [Acidimicrobiales bacterium]|nr:acyl-CoA dehydrogenase family protein [Acidimicrobiales bacterium]
MADAVESELRTWLTENLPAGWMQAVDGGDEEALGTLRAGLDDRAFLRSLGAAGWAQPGWARAHGGRGLDTAAVAVVEELKNHYRVPRSFNLLGFGLAAPTILQWGSEEQKEFFLTGMAQGEFWCQLFSEPGNGSDVAGLSTRAVRDGDEWVVNGQKVWTSGAHLADRGMLIARSDPDQPKHKGITYLVCDMHAPGVEVRPLRQITGDAEFNEVFLTDVRIPDTWRIGPEGGGWAVAQTTLMNERVALSGAFGAARPAGPPPRPGGGARPAGGAARSEDQMAAAMVRLSPSSLLVGLSGDEPGAAVSRDRLARLVIESRVASYNGARGAARRRAGQQPGPEGSVGKLFQTEFNQRLQNAGTDLLGASATAWVDNDPEVRPRVRSFLRSRGNTIEGGTSEIQRNILGDRVLGLPREPDLSRDAPWKDVPRNQA